MYLWEEFLKLVFQKKKVISKMIKIKPLFSDRAVKCFLQVVNYARIRNMLERDVGKNVVLSFKFFCHKEAM